MSGPSAEVRATAAAWAIVCVFWWFASLFGPEGPAALESLHVSAFAPALIATGQVLWFWERLSPADRSLGLSLPLCTALIWAA